MGQLKRQLVIWSAIAATTAVLPGLALADNASPEHKGGRHGRGDGRGDRQGDAKLSVAGRAISRGTTDSYGLQIRGRSGEQPTDAGGRIRFGHRGEGVAEGLIGEITCLSKDTAGVVTVTGTITRSGKHAKGEKGKGGDKDTDKGGDQKAPEMPGAPGAPSSEEDAFLDEIMPWDADEDAELGEPVRGRRGDRDGQGDRDGRRGRRGGGELAGKDFAFTINVPAKPQTFSQPVIADKGTLAACSGGGASVEVTRGGFRTRDGSAAKDNDGKGRDGKDDRRGGWWRR